MSDTDRPPDAGPSRGGGGILAAIVLFALAGVLLAVLPLFMGKKDSGKPDLTGIHQESNGLEITDVRRGPGGTEITLGATDGTLPVLGTVPEFDLATSGGARLRRYDLLGRVWIGSFIFTNCSGVCPAMSLAAAGLQSALKDDRGVVIVSMSVDPERDTMEVLRGYAMHYNADPTRWVFAGGGPGEVHSLAYNGFKLGDEEDPFLHSGKSALVDRQGRIRGYYDPREEDGFADLVRDVRRLLAEPEEAAAPVPTTAPGAAPDGPDDGHLPATEDVKGRSEDAGDDPARGDRRDTDDGETPDDDTKPDEEDDTAASLTSGSTGGITVAVVLDGEAPKRRPIDLSSDRNCLGDGEDAPLEETVIVNGNRLVNAVVWISDGLGSGPRELPTAPKTLDQKGCMYRPHVLSLTVGQPLRITNSGKIPHNVHVLPGRTSGNPELNTNQKNDRASTLTVKFEHPEVGIKVKCDVHNWMGAWIAVFEHPFHGVTGPSGTVSLGRLPPGKYVLSVWHERLAAPASQSVIVGAGKMSPVEFRFDADKRH